MIKNRRQRSIIALLCVASLLSGVGPLASHDAIAKLDPLRIVTSQIIRPNILVVLDTSGSLSMRPETSNFPSDIVGGDCYNGANCTSTLLSNTCANGLTCGAANTCSDGVSPCTVGQNDYCADGTNCYQGRLCGSGANQYECPSQVTTCANGSACQHLCQDGTSLCTSDGNCPSAACLGVCNLNNAVSCSGNADCSTPTCAGTCSADATVACTANSQCTNPTCAGRTCSLTGATCTGSCPSQTCSGSSGNKHCSITGQSCTSASQCPSNTCSTGTCNPGGTSCTSNGQCTNTCVNKLCQNAGTNNGNSCSNANSCGNNNCTQMHCSATGANCSNSSQCTNTCNTAVDACAQATGSTTCGYWCADRHTQCSNSASYCKASSGVVSSCGQVCPDNGTCYTTSHCGSGSCPSTAQSYKGSSRLAIAKHVLAQLMDETADVVHYGFMSFNQSQYFPYITAPTQTTTTQTRFFSQSELQANGGWNSSTSAPNGSFTSQNTSYTLAPSPNSNYKANKQSNTDHQFCGTTCQFSGVTWTYRGSYYTYTQVTVTGSATLGYQSTYNGPTSGGANYASFAINYANQGSCGSVSTPICGWTGGSSCSDTSLTDGAVRVQMSLSDDVTLQRANVQQIEAWLAPQSLGGLVAHGGTPTGCVLQYSASGVAPGSIGNLHDAYTYMNTVKGSDSLSGCRRNYVLLVTDGEPNGPGDNNCNAAACAAANPVTAGCGCKSVLAAYNLYKDLGVKTYAIGFGAETAGSTTLENIARAGGTCRGNGCAYFASNEAQLSSELHSAVYDALRGDYSTSPPTVATTTGSTFAGDVALLSSTEFPSWRGHLRAYDIVHVDSQGNPTLLWDAGTQLAAKAWNTRRVYTSNPSAGHALVPLLDSSGNPNGGQVQPLGLGASVTEANSIIQFILGNGRDWSMGSLLNSTPVAVGKAIDINMPGHTAYVQGTAGHPKMVYVGADDGMLHAFFLETGPNGEPAGSEAWAYIPPDGLSDVARLYSNNGQPEDPTKHIYGIATSPKVNDVCTGACAGASDWHTILVTGEGKGGTAYFALDITGQPTANPPFNVLWHTTGVSPYTQTVGESWSVPAFAFSDSGGNPVSLLLFGSGYDTTNDGSDQGNYLHVVNAFSGSPFVAPIHLTPPGSLYTTYSVIADSAVARDPNTFRSIAAYQADLGGRLWRLDHGTNISSPLLDMGTSHPFYYAPAASVSDPAQAQVTVAAADSTFDDDDMNKSSSPEPNLTVLVDVGGQPLDSAHLFTRPISSFCADGCHRGSCGGCPHFTASARPVGSPVLLTNLDSQATAQMQALFLVYQPAASSCSQGETTLVVLDVVGNPSPVVQSEARVVPVSGKASGIFIGAGGEVLIGTSGGGNTPSALKVVAGQPVVSSVGAGSTFNARIMGMTEVSN